MENIVQSQSNKNIGIVQDWLMDATNKTYMTMSEEHVNARPKVKFVPGIKSHVNVHKRSYS
jgi:hypothetical protein